MNQGRYYVTTSIPYVNARPHVGHALEFVQADVLARFARQRGDDTRFLTGTDDNALKNVQAAEAEGIPVRELVDRNAAQFAALSGLLGISNDDFIRTSTEERHRDGVQKLWRACERAGDIYRRAYRGLYCVGCEQFYTEDELIDGRCPEHGTVPELIEEENAFFRLSRYADRLHEMISRDELLILPRERKNEVLRFIESGLEDFSISRSVARARGWGIEVPDNPGQVMYVWVDALANYITALDYATEGPNFQRYWSDAPDRVHVIGKGILRFHAIYWPAMLLSAGVPLPTHVVVHGYLTIGGQKMSKSLGNVIDPAEVAEQFGSDPLRYYLLREFSPFADGDFTTAKLAGRYRTDLANDLGNLLNRTVSMIGRYREGIIPLASAGTELEDELWHVAQDASRRVEQAMRGYNPQEALNAVWEVVTRANGYVEASAPWTLAKQEREGGSSERLDTVLSTLATVLGRLAWMLAPFLPETSQKIAEQLGSAGIEFAPFPGQHVAAPQPIFPRLEDEAAV